MKKRLQEEMQLLNTTPILVIGVVLYSLVILDTDPYDHEDSNSKDNHKIQVS